MSETEVRGDIVEGIVLVGALAFALIPVFVFPSFLGIGAEAGKGIFAGSVAGAVLLALSFAFVFMRRRALTPPGAALLGFPLFIAASVSAAFLHLSPAGFWGSALETGTPGSLIIFGIIFFIAALLPTKRVSLVAVAFGGSVLFAGIVSLTGVFIPALMETVAGAWSTLAILVVATLVALVTWSDWSDRPRLLMLIPALALVGIFLAFFQTEAAVVSVLVLTLSAVARFVTRRSARPIATAVILCVIGGALLAGMRDPLVPNLPAEGRPSAAATVFILAPAFLSSPTHALLGTGSFVEAWQRYRPVSFNETPLWNVTPEEGWSFVSTIAVTGGAAAVLAFFTVPLSVFGLALRRREGNALQVALAAASSVLVLALVVHPGGAAVVFALALALGLLAALSIATPGARTLPFIAQIGAGIVALVVGALLVWIAVHQGIAVSAHSFGERIESENPLEASLLYEEAAQSWGVGSYYADAMRAAYAAAVKTGPLGNPQAVRDALTRARAFANSASAAAPENGAYRLIRAELYIRLIPLGVENAETYAQASLVEAAERDPYNPRIPYLAALIAVSHEDVAGAKAKAQEALSLKADYAPALELLSHTR